MLEGNDSAYSSKAIDFKNKQAKEMGLSTSVYVPEELTTEELEKKEVEEKKRSSARISEAFTGS